MSTKIFMLNNLKNFKIYESYTCRDDAGNRLKYDLLSEEPPVGLLRDIAVGETELTKKENDAAMNVFSAYCLYHGAKVLGKKDGDDILGYQLVLEAVKCAEKCHASGNYKGFHSLLANLVNWRYRDAMRKGCFRIKDDGPSSDGNGGKWQSRTTSMDYGFEDKGAAEMKDEVKNRIAEISLDHADQAERIEHTHESIEYCRNLGDLSKEQFDIICHCYGISEAHDEMKQTKIAKKLGVSNTYVHKKLAAAYKIIRDFIECDGKAA